MSKILKTPSGPKGPTVYVTKNRQRIKQYENNTVYLNNGDEFELELYNPTNKKVLAKITINGNNISSSGIVLRPAERVFLERYVDEPKKFLFETYKVSGSSDEIKKAIQNNGSVSVKFYEEYVPLPTYWYNNYQYINTNLTPLNGQMIYTTNSTSGNVSGNMYDVTSLNNMFYSSSNTSSVPINNVEVKNVPIKNILRGNFESAVTQDSLEIETGRVEKGSNSNQNFQYDYSTYNSFHSWEMSWNVLPSSTKPVVKEDLTTYCVECGSKRKKSSHKFCPHCGTEY